MTPERTFATSTTLACSMVAPSAATCRVFMASAPRCPDERTRYIAWVSGPVMTPVATETLRMPEERDAKLSCVSPAPVRKRLTACWKSAAILVEMTPTAISPATSNPEPITASERNRASVASAAAPTPNNWPSEAAAPSIATRPISWLATMDMWLLLPIVDDLLRLGLGAHVIQCLVFPPEGLLDHLPGLRITVLCGLEERIIPRALPELAIGRKPPPQLCPFS